MNKHSYRIIFNKKRGAFMAVAETAKSHGKESYSSRGPTGQHHPALMRLIGLAVAVAAALGSVTVVNAQMVSDPNAAGNKRPVMDTAANGRPLVQIATPGAAGVSHNQFTQFNVDANGAILNNARGAVQTQLGGYVAANPNLANGAARVILNEVTGTSASLLRGYTEVAGQRAEVIIANPNGISCDGCGFINTSRGMLTTGAPMFGGDGSLDAFRVTKGHIQIGAGGLNGANMDQLDLIARSVAVNGELWGNQLNVIAGANQVKYADLGVQVIQGDGNKPTVGIDVAQLGGMYANKIRLVGTEAGVGVNSLGNIAAQGGELSIDNAGKITLAGNTSATEKLTLAGGDDIANSGTLYGQKEVAISSQKEVGNSGILAAQGDLTVSGNSIHSTNVLAAGVDANGAVTQSGNLSVRANQTLSATGQNIAATDLSLTGGNLNLAGATTSAGGSAVLTATAGDINNQGGALSAAKDIAIQAAQRVQNMGGRIEANAADSVLSVAGARIDNTGGRITNSGTGLTQLSATEAVVNANTSGDPAMGVIGGNGDLRIQADTFSNTQHAKLVAGNDLSLHVANGIDNNSGSISALRNIDVAARDLDNTGGQIGNLGNGGGNLVINASATVVNAGGKIGSDHDLALAAQTVQGAGQIVAGNDAIVNLQGDYTAAAGTLLQANHDLTLNGAGNINNAGAIQAVGTLTVNAANLTNQAAGTFKADTTALTANSGAGDIANAGAIGGNAVTTSSNRFDNTGAVIGDTITVNSNSLFNQGNAAVIAATSNVNLFVKNAMVNADGALIYGLGGLTIAADNTQDANGNFLHKTQQLTNSSATMETEGDLTVSAANITNKRTTLDIQRDIYDGSVSWSKYNYYWRSWGSGMTGPDSAGLMGAVTRTLPFNDPNAFASPYGSIVQIDAGSNRALVQFQGSNQLWVYYKTIKKNADNSYDMTFYEGKYCPGHGELCPYQQVVYREYQGVQVVDQFDPSRFTSPAELHYIGVNGQSAYDFRERTFNGAAYHDAVTAASAAAKMSASGKITINTDNLTNDASDITAGGAITINGAASTGGSGGVVTNRGYSINRTDIGVATDHYDRAVGHHSYATFNDTVVTSVSTVDANIQSSQGVNISAPTINNTTAHAAQVPGGTNALGSNGLQNLTLPQNGLFSMHAGPGQRYLVETDPRFTNYRNFLSSDYMLSRLAMDPARIQKRLGDGFYEQKLINDQIAELSGKRFLDGYASAEEQFKALMDSGVATAAQFKLTPGIALTGAQMAALTRDIVWMVDQEIALPDGSRQHALVPVVYLTQAHQADLKSSGALIGGQSVALTATDTINNSGIVKAKADVIARANVIDHKGGEIRGDVVDLKGAQQLNIGTDFQNAGRQGSIKGREVTLAGGDIGINGAKVAASESLDISADNNLTVGSATAQRSASFEWGKAGNSTADHGLMRDGGVSANWTQVLGSSIESGGDLSMRAGKDISIKGSTVAATGQAAIVAGGHVDIGADKNISTSHVTGRSDRQQITADAYTETVVGSSVEGGKGLTIVAQGNNGSRGDINVAASNLSSADGQTILGAAGSLNIAGATQRRTNDLYEAGGDAWAKTNEKSAEAIGSRIGGEKGVTLVAQGATNAGRVDIIGSDVTSNGRIDVVAKDSVNIAESRTETYYERTAHQESSGFLSSKSSDSHDRVVQSLAKGGTISGDQVNIQSGKDVVVQGSNVVGTRDVAVNARDNVTITTAQSATDESHFKQEKQSGLMGSGGIGFTLGSRQQDGQGDSKSVINTASTVGSVDGNISITAGNQYKQTGSQVIAGAGDIDIAAKSVDINTAVDTSTYAQETKYKQSGLSVSLTSPVVSALQTGQQMVQAAQKTSDPRMQALAAATAGYAAKGAYDGAQSIMDNPSNMGGIKISVSVGSAKNESSTVQNSSAAVGSTVAAGGSVNIRATGGQEDSNINAVGSTITAGSNVNLSADNQINLLAAQNTASQTSKNSNSGASVGIGFAIGGSQNGFTLELGATKGRGNADGTDIAYTNTNIRAGNTVNLRSSGDTTLKGAVVAANTVQADIGGNLNIESLQDTSQFDSKQSSAGIGVSLCIPPFCYGTSSVSGSVSNAKVNGDYASVTEQSGVKSGDGGFQIQVAGNTDLKGGVIASTDKAIQDNRNSLTTATLTQSDIQNKDTYDASSYSIGGSVSGKMGDQGSAPPGADQRAAEAKSSPSGSAGVGRESGNQSSMTRSGISGGSILITDNTQQQAATGQTAEQAIDSINRGVSTDKDTGGALRKAWNGDKLQQEVQAQAQITAAFGASASKAVGDYADKQVKDAQMRGDQEEAAKWAEGGTYRVAAHVAVGALGGQVEGALGAGAAASAAPLINNLVDGSNLPDPVKQAVGGALSVALGAVAGGGAGAAAGLNQDLNNRQLHPAEEKWIEQNAKRYAARKGISADEAERQLAQQAYRQVQDGAAGAWDQQASEFLKEARGMLPGDGVNGIGYMFQTTAAQKADMGMYANYLPQTSSFYAKNGLTIPSGQQLAQGIKRDSDARDTAGALTKLAAIASGATALAGLPPALLTWALSNPAEATKIGLITVETAAAIQSEAITPTLVAEAVAARAGQAAANNGLRLPYLSNSTAPDIQRRLSSAVSTIRSEAGIPTGGNVGFAEVSIPAVSKEQLVMKAYSGYDEAVGSFLPKPSGSMDTWILKPSEATSKYVGGPGAYLRDVDTEFKILETVTQRLGNNTTASGQINLFTEKLVCPSCSDVVNQFRQRYPNIQLNVFTGK